MESPGGENGGKIDNLGFWSNYLPPDFLFGLRWLKCEGRGHENGLDILGLFAILLSFLVCVFVHVSAAKTWFHPNNCKMMSG